MAGTNIKMLQKTGRNIESDECYTPPEAIEPLLEFLDKGLVYYDCTSGVSSKLVETMSSKGFTCITSGAKNFLTEDLPDNIDVIITNPPYSKKDAFIRRCYELDKPFALLLPVSSLQGQNRGKMFRENGIEILALTKRIDFTGKGNPHFGVAWFCHSLLENNLIFR